MKFPAQIFALSIFFVVSFPTCAQSDDVINLLRNNDIARLETSLGTVQRKFENGQATEYELRNAFRPFYTLDAQSEQNLRNWAANAPRSYNAHLALGIFYKRKGTDARGDNAISETPKKNLADMERYFALSESELHKSMGLAKNPYLSIFFLLAIAGVQGDADEAHALLLQANKGLPSNALARGRYAVFLTPRWGGSYAKLDGFIAESAAQGAPANVVNQLQAIEFNDKGLTLEEHGNHTAAKEQFIMALKLGEQIGGTFKSEFLETSLDYICGNNNSASYYH